MAIVPANRPPMPAWGKAALNCMEVVAQSLARKGNTLDADMLDLAMVHVREGIAAATPPHPAQSADKERE